MTDQELDDLEARLLGACNGHPSALIPWPHRVLHDAADAIAELREKNAGLVGALKGIAGAIECGTKATGERPHYLKGKDGGKIEGEEIDTICEALLSIGRLARKALKENAQ